MAMLCPQRLEYSASMHVQMYDSALYGESLPILALMHR